MPPQCLLHNRCSIQVSDEYHRCCKMPIKKVSVTLVAPVNAFSPPESPGPAPRSTLFLVSFAGHIGPRGSDGWVTALCPSAPLGQSPLSKHFGGPCKPKPRTGEKTRQRCPTSWCHWLVSPASEGFRLALFAFWFR